MQMWIQRVDLIWLTNKQADQLSSAHSNFNLPVIAGYSMCLASFLMQWMWLCLLFTISCFSAGKTLETIYNLI